MRSARVLLLGTAFALLAASSWAQPVTVTHSNGLLSIHCADAPLSSVFESIEREAGIDLILEDEVKSKRLTADLTDVPVAMAVQRLLEGIGVNYIVMMDSVNWGRVGKIFVGAGGGGPARSALPRGPVAPEPVDEAYPEDPVDMPEMMDNFDTADPNLDDPNLEAPPEDPGAFGDPNDPGAFGNPPGSSPIPDFLPPNQAFPRSNFTPGLPNNRPQSGTTQQPPQTNPSNPPPATFPFTDPFGQPIPIPPGMNPQQQDPNRRQQQQ